LGKARLERVVRLASLKVPVISETESAEKEVSWVALLTVRSPSIFSTPERDREPEKSEETEMSPLTVEQELRPSASLWVSILVSPPIPVS